MKMMLLVLAWVLVLAGPACSQDGSAILRQVDTNLQPESFESYRKLINIEPNGAQREFLLYTLKKGQDKIASLFLAPASDKGRATLRLGDNMWLYIPNVGKPIRITSLQSVVGGVFNNADIMRLDYHVEYDVQTLEEKGSNCAQAVVPARPSSMLLRRAKALLWRPEIGPRERRYDCLLGSASGMLWWQSSA